MADQNKKILNKRFLDDSDFESILLDCFDEIPPEDIVQKVTPWKNAMDHVLVGIAFTTCMFEFLGLNYILPFIGHILTVLGFRVLRRENVWFKSCGMISVFRAVYWYAMFLGNMTVYRAKLEQSNAHVVLTLGSMVVSVIFFYCLWRGFKAVKKKAGLLSKARSAAALLVWYLITLWFSVMKYSGFLGWILILSYACIIVCLFGLSKELEKAGYVIHSTLVKISDRVLVAGILIVLLVGSVCCIHFWGRYPMKWSEQSDVEKNTEANQELESIKNNLKELGFPEHILDDLLEEDIRDCKDASYVVVETQNHCINDGYVTEVARENGTGTFVDRIYDVNDLCTTSVGVLLSQEEEKWKIFHHFQYIVDTEFYGTECIQIRFLSENWEIKKGIKGQLLYDLGEKIYTAPYYSLEDETYTTASMFGGMVGGEVERSVFAEFSLPNEGENHRGYLSYEMKRNEGRQIINSWFVYDHQYNWLQYPVTTAKEYRIIAQTQIFGQSAPFKTAWHMFQFHFEEGLDEKIS